MQFLIESTVSKILKCSFFKNMKITVNLLWIFFKLIQKKFYITPAVNKRCFSVLISTVLILIFIFALLIGVKSNSGVEHLFLFLFAISIASSVKFLLLVF